MHRDTVCEMKCHFSSQRSFSEEVKIAQDLTNEWLTQNHSDCIVVAPAFNKSCPWDWLGQTSCNCVFFFFPSLPRVAQSTTPGFTTGSYYRLHPVAVKVLREKVLPKVKELWLGASALPTSSKIRCWSDVVSVWARSLSLRTCLWMFELAGLLLCVTMAQQAERRISSYQRHLKFRQITQSHCLYLQFHNV